MEYKADLHTHIDGGTFQNPNRQHGADPNELAQAVIDADLDVVASTEHMQPTDRFFDFQEAVQEISEETGKKVDILLGTELAIVHDNAGYHVGYIFENQDAYHRQNLPDMLHRHAGLYELEDFQKEYPGKLILFHPSWKDHLSHYKNNPELTQELMKSGIFDGIEIVNGSILHYMHKNKDKQLQSLKRGIEMFHNAKQEDPSLAALGNSDAHNLDVVGSVFTQFSGDTSHDIFRVLERGDTQVGVQAKQGSNEHDRLQEILPDLDEKGVQYIDPHDQ